MEVRKDAPNPGKLAKPAKKKPAHSHSTLWLWMLVDGIGLAIVAGATVMEGIHIWKEFLYLFWSSNQLSLMFWFGGRTLQVVGLMFLIGFAASFQLFPSIEQFGMFLITTGPLLNMISCHMFHDPEDPSRLYNQQWVTTELVEFTGMCVLDVSLIHMEEIYVLSAELIGFFILCCAAILQYSYIPGVPVPNVSARLDIVHVSECVGLIFLSIVAVAQYQIKLHKAEQLRNKHESNCHLHERVSSVISPNSVITLSDIESGNLSNSHSSNNNHIIRENGNNSPGRTVRHDAVGCTAPMAIGSTMQLPSLHIPLNSKLSKDRSPRKGGLQIV